MKTVKIELNEYKPKALKAWRICHNYSFKEMGMIFNMYPNTIRDIENDNLINEELFEVYRFCIPAQEANECLEKIQEKTYNNVYWDRYTNKSGSEQYNFRAYMQSVTNTPRVYLMSRLEGFKKMYPNHEIFLKKSPKLTPVKYSTEISINENNKNIIFKKQPQTSKQTEVHTNSVPASFVTDLKIKIFEKNNMWLLDDGTLVDSNNIPSNILTELIYNYEDYNEVMLRQLFKLLIQKGFIIGD